MNRASILVTSATVLALGVTGLAAYASVRVTNTENTFLSRHADMNCDGSVSKYERNRAFEHALTEHDLMRLPDGRLYNFFTNEFVPKIEEISILERFMEENEPVCKGEQLTLDDKIGDSAYDTVKFTGHKEMFYGFFNGASACITFPHYLANRKRGGAVKDPILFSKKPLTGKIAYGLGFSLVSVSTIFSCSLAMYDAFHLDFGNVYVVPFLAATNIISLLGSKR